MEQELAKRLAAKAARGELMVDDPLEPELARLHERSGAMGDSDERARHVARLMDIGDDEDDEEHAPDSGIRASVSDAESVRPLTYSMYTISDLEVHGPRPSIVLPAPQVVRWADAWKAALEVVVALKGWARSSPRPRMLDVCRFPLIGLGAALRALLQLVPWKRVAFGFGAAFGSVLLFCFAVFTVAELTDDLKPSRGATAILNGTKVVKKEAMTAPDAPAEPVGPVLELDDGPLNADQKAEPATSESGPVASKPKLTRSRLKGKKPTERFIP